MHFESHEILSNYTCPTQNLLQQPFLEMGQKTRIFHFKNRKGRKGKENGVIDFFSPSIQ